jgi:endonuclease/exonuclease/phosphatase family metal-dependent hydrolase
MPVSLRLLTWNVLHRVHALNWKEPVIEGFPDEGVRIARITDFVLRWLDGESAQAPDASVVCLQEASGDQLRSLTLAVSARGDVAIFDHLYPRLPRLRAAGDAGLLDPQEHLVTLVKTDAAGPAKREGRTYDEDPGKGFLAVELGSGLVVINTHVSFGEKATAQLALVSAGVGAATAFGAVAGDFNAPAETVARAFGAGVVLSDLAGQGPTRVPASGHPGKTIDHVAAFRGRVESAHILLESEGLSDHLPVTATLVFV